MLAVADADARRPAAQRAQPGPGAGHGLGRPRPARLQLPAHRARRPRSASPSSSGSTRCSPPAPRAAALYDERLAALDYGAPAGDGDPDGLVLPCADEGEERRSWFVYAVRLPRGADRDAVDRRPRPARGRGEGLHAVHPPDGPHARALRLRRGPVPGRRGRLGAPARAAVLPGDRPRADRPGLRGARRGAAGQLEL